MSEATKAFAKLIEEAARERRLKAALPGLDEARSLPLAELRRLWDSYDAVETANPRISGETVHFVLNERGDGDYCAI